ncbi:MAG: multidrug effflux MFS transporter [Alphaproteobacteria bacterium]
MPPPVPSRFSLIAILAVVAGMGPMSIQIVVPLLPRIEATFAAGHAFTQIALSGALVAMAIAPLGYGPAADRFGRRPVLLFGIGAFVVGSALCFWAPSAWVLIAGRIVQAVGGAAGAVVSRTILRDLYSREESAKALSYMLSMVVLAPLLTPVLGGLIADAIDWHWAFAFTLGLGVAALAFTLVAIPETRPARRATNFLREMRTAFPALLRSPGFLAYAAYAAGGMGAFQAMAGGVPFLGAQYFGWTPTEFALHYMIMPISFMVGTFLSARLTQRVGIDRMILRASVGGAVAALAIPALFAAGYVTPWAIFGPGCVLGVFNGLSMPNAQAGGVSVNPAMAGSASGLMMFMQMTGGAVFAQAAGMLPHDTPIAIALLIASAAVFAAVAFSGLMTLARRRA